MNYRTTCPTCNSRLTARTLLHASATMLPGGAVSHFALPSYCDLCDKEVDIEINPTPPAPIAQDLRDYLAVHAPVDPQDWFEPKVGPAPVKPIAPTGFGEEIRRALSDWAWDGSYDIDVEQLLERAGHKGNSEMYDAIDAWVESVEEFELASTEYSKAYRKARRVQWPYAWADAQLEERNRRQA